MGVPINTAFVKTKAPTVVTCIEMYSMSIDMHKNKWPHFKGDNEFSYKVSSF